MRIVFVFMIFRYLADDILIILNIIRMIFCFYRIIYFLYRQISYLSVLKKFGW